MEDSGGNNNFERNVKLFVFLYTLAIVLGFYFILSGRYIGRDLINAAVAMATILMAGFVALQTKATAKSVDQAIKQAKLMNESLIEMKKERMNIEYIKNEVVGYIESVKKRLKDNLPSINNTGVWSEVPAYSPSISISGTTYDTSYQKIGFEKRIARKINRLLSEYEIELEEYNSLVREANRLRREVTDNLKGKSELVRALQEISNEEARRYTVREDHIIKATTLIEELVTWFNPKERYWLSAPNYGRLGLDPEQERLYGLEVWNKAEQRFHEFIEANPTIYNAIIKRQNILERLKERTESLLKQIQKMETELLQSEKELEKRLLEL